MPLNPVRTLLVALGLWCCASPLAAQDEEQYTKEIGVAAGAAFMLDDANSSFYGNTNVSGGLLFRFVFNARSALKSTLTYSRVSGNVGNVNNFYPDRLTAPTTQRLSYTYAGGIANFSALYELHFFPYGYYRNYLGNRRLTPFVQAGFGFTYSDVSKAFTASIPLGVGLKYKIRPRLNLSLDWTIHFSLSDRLEGLEAPTGLKSEMFRNKDHLGLTMLTLTYDFSPRCPACNKAD